MKTDEKILKRFDEIINLGQKVLDTKKHPLRKTLNGDFVVDYELAYQWLTSAQNLTERVFGKDSPHSILLIKFSEKKVTYGPATVIQGIIKAAKDDYETETVFHLKELITADLFEDFLEQSEYLISSNYYQPAAVIVGAVLEDGLRKLCDKHGITLPAKPKLDTINADLARKGIYSKLVQKQITAHADIRNNAAHGNWDKFSEEDVKDFLKWTRSFMSQYIT